MKKALRETQTLHAGCSKVEPKILAPPQTPFPGPRDGQNLISWRQSLPLFKNPVWWGSMYTISSYHGNRPTNKQTQPQTHRQDQLQYTVPQLACSVIAWKNTRKISVTVKLRKTGKRNSSLDLFTNDKVAITTNPNGKCTKVPLFSFLFV